MHKMLEEQLRKKFEEQKEQIANKIKEVEAEKNKFKDKMAYHMSGKFNLTAAEKLKEEDRQDGEVGQGADLMSLNSVHSEQYDSEEEEENKDQCGSIINLKIGRTTEQ
jgi:hypothetical protein